MSATTCPGAGGTRLYVAVARSRGEKVAVEDLRAKGLTAYAPTFRKWARSATGKRVKVDLPVFARYVFVLSDDIARDFAGVRHARRIEGVLGCDGLPKALTGKGRAMVAAVLLAEVFGGLDDTRARVKWRSVGQRVRVVAGMFQGAVGTLTKVSDSELRVKVDVGMLKGELKLKPDQVADADAVRA